MTSFEEKTVSKATIYDGKIIRVEKAMIEAPNHKLYARELVYHRGAICILPILEDGRVILVRQYRKALESDLWEIPAGKIEREDVSLKDTALRELEEEIQYTGHLEEIMSFYPSPGFSSERLTLFIATNLTKVSHPLPCDEDEFLEVRAFDTEALHALFKTQKLDAKTVIALQYMAMHKKGS